MFYGRTIGVLFNYFKKRYLTHIIREARMSSKTHVVVKSKVIAVDLMTTLHKQKPTLLTACGMILKRYKNRVRKTELTFSTTSCVKQDLISSLLVEFGNVKIRSSQYDIADLGNTFVSQLIVDTYGVDKILNDGKGNRMFIYKLPDNIKFVISMLLLEAKISEKEMTCCPIGDGGKHFLLTSYGRSVENGKDTILNTVSVQMV